MTTEKGKLFAKDVGYQQIGAFSRRDPFVISFVFPRNDRPYILKGSSKKIEAKLKQLQTLGMKAVVWNLEYVKLRNGKKITHHPSGKIIGLPMEYSAFIQKMYGRDKQSRYGRDAVSNNHKYLLQIGKKETVLDENAIPWKRFRVIFQKSFKNQPRCFPKCLDQFIPLEEQNKPIENEITFN